MTAPPTEFRELGLAKSVAKLLRLRLIIQINSFRRGKARTKFAFIFLPLGLFLFLLAISINLFKLLHSPILAQHVGNTTPYLECFPSMVISIAGIGILLTSFSALLQTLYLSGDMDFLLSAPTPIRAVFLAKMIQAVLPNFIILSVLALPALFGLGLSSGYRFPFYPCVVIILTIFALTAASLASLLVMAVARFFPPRRVAEVIGFIVGLGFFCYSQFSQYLNFSRLGESQVAGLGVFVTRFNNPWSPMAWAGRGLVDVGKGEWISGFILLAIPLVLSGLCFAVALATSEKLYYTGWASLQHKKTKTKAGEAAKAVVFKKTNLLFRAVPAPVRAILSKDLRLCFRDLSNLSGLVFPLIMGIVYAIGLIRSHGQMPAGRGRAPHGFIEAGNAVLLYGDIGLALFMGWMLVANLEGMAFTREGRNYWMLKAAPVNTRQMLTAKFLVGYIPSALICSVYVLALGILKHTDVLSIIISLLSVWMMVAGLCGIYLAFGTRGAKFDWENPSQRRRSVGCLGFIVGGLIFLPVCFSLFVAPAIVAQVFHFPVLIGRIIGLLLGGAWNSLAVIIPLAMVAKRVSTLNET
jgi:ABC-2 type transport system permease protein